MNLSVLSRMKPETLISMLEQSARESLDGSLGGKGKHVLAYFKGRRFVLAMARSHLSWNWFAPIFWGEVRPLQAGSEIKGRFRMTPTVRYLILLWLVLFVTGCVVNLRNYGLVMSKFRGVFPAAIFLFGVVVVRTGQWLGRIDEVYLKKFMEKIAAGA